MIIKQRMCTPNLQIYIQKASTFVEHVLLLVHIKNVASSDVASSEMMRPCTCFPRVSKIQILAYNREYSVIIRNAIILNIVYNTFIRRDTEVVVCIILNIVKRVRVMVLNFTLSNI